MFRVIGADQKEYGPINAAQVRQWIADGRLNENSQARREDGDWQALSSFEEFADVFHPQIPGQPQAQAGSTPFATTIPSGSSEEALQAVKGPAIALIVTASIGVVLYLLSALGHFAGAGNMFQHDLSNIPPQWREIINRTQGPSGGFYALFSAAINGFVLLGAIKMLRLQGRSLAFAACIVAMLPCSCCCFFGIPFGIWGLVVLNRPEVKDRFDLV
jgi:hypothetical protein